MHATQTNSEVPHDPVVSCLQDIAGGAVRLSRREIECLQGLARGLYDAQIAKDLGLSHSTIRLHLKNARAKLAARTREQALVKAVLLGLIEAQ